MTDDLEFLIIRVGKEYSSPKWYIKCQLHPKEWVNYEYIYIYSEILTIEALKLMSRSDKIDPSRLGASGQLYQEFVIIDHYVSPILHNLINLGNNVLYNLFDYSNDIIEKNIEEEIVRNS